MDIENLIQVWKRNSRNISKRNTNYDTGLTVETITDRRIKKGFVISWNTSYTKFVNDGTKFIKAYQFVERSRDDIAEMIESGRNALQFVDRPSKQTLVRREIRRARENRFRRGG